jgi:hypothetical protein
MAHQTHSRLEYSNFEIRFIPLQKTVAKPDPTMRDLFHPVKGEAEDE